MEEEPDANQRPTPRREDDQGVPQSPTGREPEREDSDKSAQPTPPVVQKPPVKPVEEPVASKPPEKPPEKPVEPVVENPPAKPAEDKLELPKDEAVEAAVQDVHNAFKEDYARQTNKGRQELAAKLLEEGRRSKDDPVKRFALYREARDLAAQGAAPALSVEATEAMVKDYPLDSLEAKVAALKLAGKTADTPDTAKAFLLLALPLLKDAREADRYDAVTPLVLPVRLALRHTRDAEQKRTAEPLLAQVEYLRKQYDPVKAAVQVLKEKPDDPRANLSVGRFLCFHKKDWEKGLPLLVKGGDKALADAAEKDLAQPGDTAEQVALGDAWYDLAKAQADVRTTLQRRAGDWYVRAILDLSGADKLRIEKRVVEVSKNSPEMRTAWNDLDISGAVAVGGAYLRLPPGRLLAIKKPLAGQFEIVIVCRAAKQVPHFEVLQDRDVIAQWEHKDGTLWFKRPRRGGSGFPVTFTPDRWETFTCRQKDGGLEGKLDGRGSLFLRGQAPANVAKPRTFLIRALEATLEVRSFTVKPINP